jgi:parvulin-like peptidyl-prolyl isomerase
MGGCTTAPVRAESVLAVVDGAPITRADMDYSFRVTHRREDLSSAGAIDLHDYLQKVIDERLIYQEARRMGMEQLQEVRKSLDAYILRQSVAQLYNDEIKGKISVTEEDVKAYFMKYYELFTLDIVKVKSEGEAKRVVEELRSGKDFREVAQESSGGEEITLSRIRLADKPALEEAVIGLMPGEFSDFVKEENTYFIVKLNSRAKPSDDEFEERKARLESIVWKQKENERTKEYLEQLRQSADMNIDRELLAAFDPEKAEEWSGNDKPLAEVYDSVLTVGDFTAMVGPGQPKEQILNSWVDVKLVDYVALGRNYDKETELKEAVRRYEDRLLRNTFIFRVMVPQVEASDEALKEYYSDNIEKYMKPLYFKLQQITVKSEDEAQEVLENLGNGADFSWLAKTRSTDEVAFKGGDVGLLSFSELPEQARDAVKTLEPGDISPIIEIDSEYRIMRLQMRTKEEPEDFRKVRGAVYKDYFDDKMTSISDEYIFKLREEAEIKIYDRTVRKLEKSLQK